MDEPKTLRGLAKAYANGQIDKNRYRQKRTSYLQAVLSGEVTVPDKGSAEAVGNTSDTFNYVAFNKNDINPAIQQQGAGGKRPPRKQGLLTRQNIILAGVILLVAVVASVLLIPGESDNATSPEGRQGGAPEQNTMADRPPSAAQNLISAFLEQNTWSQDSLDSFLMDWRSIAESQRTTTMTSTEFSRLVNAIYKKLLEERALSRIGNAQTAYEKQRALVDFAAAIGVKDQRITLPEPPPDNTP